MNLTLADYILGIQSGTFTPQEVVESYLTKAQNLNDQYFSYVRFHLDYIKDHLDDFANRPLRSAPLAIKDIILTEGYITSCGSKMLEKYVCPYSATCFSFLERAGGLMLGKANMDEFAMGSSTETSYFGKTTNPYGVDRVPGGSSGGSAAAVASDCCLAALGTDTGGSVRQPAAFCGIVGMKPTYGMVSRYGVQSMASSLDQVGVMTKTVEDAEILLKAIAGFDPKDSQSSTKADDFVSAGSIKLEFNDLKIAVPKQALGDGLDPRVKTLFLQRIEQLRVQGYLIDEIDLPIMEYAVSMYYTLMPAEVSTNLSRFDGIRFGLQEESQTHEDVVAYYQHMRGEGFGDEAKRRILLGTFVLSSANYEGYYLKAQEAREQLKSDFDAVFAKYDLILTPTTPEIAWKFGERSEDPLKMYMSDMYAIPANMAGLPAMSVPMGMIEDRGETLPAGLQIMGQRWNETKVFALGKVVENLV